jgi:hypothetical protein
VIEEWKKIPVEGFNYEASSLGRIRNADTGYVLRPGRTGAKTGPTKWSLSVRLSNKGAHQQFRVSRLVLYAFVGVRPAEVHAMHLDDDHYNNTLSNLRWGTPAENAKDMASKGRGGIQKLTTEDVNNIRARRAAGERGRRLAQEYAISEQRICDLHKGRTSLIV